MNVLRSLSVAALGIFAGAMLTEGFILVPYWRSLAPNEFFTWYAANGRRLLEFFGAVTVIAGTTILVDALVAFARRDPGRSFVVLAAGLIVAVILMFPIYFQQVNESFAAATIPPGDLHDELARWAMWHRVRTVLSVAALVLASLAPRASRESRRPPLRRF
jgi:hypothetical protein